MLQPSRSSNCIGSIIKRPFYLSTITIYKQREPYNLLGYAKKTLVMAKIKTVEYFRVKPRWLMVKITDENGEYGWGEATLEGHDLAVEGCLDEMVARIVGMEAK